MIEGYESDHAGADHNSTANQKAEHHRQKQNKILLSDSLTAKNYSCLSKILH